MGIVSKSPTRVDLAGGTLDIMPMTHILGPKCTVNFGVTLHAEVKVELSKNGNFSLVSLDQKLATSGSWNQVITSAKIPWLEKLLANFWAADLPPLDIEVSAKSPAGAGLGGSSCLGIAMASALVAARKECGHPLLLDERQLVQTVQDLETSLIRVPTGCQDYWGGLRGGVNVISYPPGGAVVETLRSEQTKDIDELLMLCYSGVSRASGSNNWAIFKKAFEGDKYTLGVLEEISQLSVELSEKIKKGLWTEVFRISEEEWNLRKRLWSDIETPETMRIAEFAKKGGAHFSRICGAGGGGVMAIFADKKQHSLIQKLVEEVGGRILDASVSWSGTVVSGALHG